MITPKSLKRLKLEKMVVGADECAEEIQYFDWNWHILSRAKKSYEICKSIDYTSSAFPRRTQWWLWQLKPCFSPAFWILHISGALIYYLFNGRILSEALFISQMEGSIKKKRQILVVLFRLGERLAKISSKPCSKVWGMGQARPGEKCRIVEGFSGGLLCTKLQIWLLIFQQCCLPATSCWIAAHCAGFIISTLVTPKTTDV